MTILDEDVMVVLEEITKYERNAKKEDAFKRKHNFYSMGRKYGLFPHRPIPQVDEKFETKNIYISRK